MRKILFTLLAAGAMLAAIPAASATVGGDHHQGNRHREPEHRREHRAGHHHRHVGIRHERFGEDAGHDAGTVVAFAGRRLTIRLVNGSNVTGAVSRFTEVECEMRGDGNDRGDDRGDDGPSHDAGDDHGHGGSGHRGGEDRGPGHDDNGRDHRCATIAPGMTVREATLSLTRFEAVWTRLELIGS